MIKRGQYIQLSLLILLIFVLFQFSSYSISFYNKYDADEKKQTIPNESEYGMKDNTKDILVVAGSNGEAAFQITQELTYMKRGFLLKEDLFSVTQEEMSKLKLIILASDTMEGYYDLATVQAYIDQGINVILAVLPVKELDNSWKNVLGISQINNEVSQVGLLTFRGFFLGGKQDYKNLVVDAPYIKVASSCKTYIVGYKEKNNKSKIRQYDFMYDIVWRNIYGNSQIYVINGSGMNQFGCGILSAIFAQMYPDYLYPVINAKALIINNAPYLTKENSAEMMEHYTRNAERLFADLVLPSIISVSLSNHCVPTLYGVSGFDQGTVEGKDYSTEILPLLQKDLDRIGGEIGISAYDMQDSSSKEKVLTEIQLYGNKLGNSALKSLHIGQFDQSACGSLVEEVEKQIPLTSVVSYADDRTTFSYYKDDIVNVPIISRGFEYSETEYLKLQSMATALGVIVHETDMKDIIFPESYKDDWTQAITDLSSMLDSYWKPYEAYKSMNVTEMSERISRFLVMSPDITINDDVIQVRVNHFDTEAFFILRTEKEISEITNGIYNKIEDGAYLITAKEANLTINLKPNVYK